MVVAKVAVVAREAADVARVAAKVTKVTNVARTAWVRPIIETTNRGSGSVGSEGSGLSWDRSRGYARNAWTAVAA